MVSTREHRRHAKAPESRVARETGVIWPATTDATPAGWLSVGQSQLIGKWLACASTRRGVYTVTSGLKVQLAEADFLARWCCSLFGPGAMATFHHLAGCSPWRAERRQCMSTHSVGYHRRLPRVSIRLWDHQTPSVRFILPSTLRRAWDLLGCVTALASTFHYGVASTVRLC